MLLANWLHKRCSGKQVNCLNGLNQPISTKDSESTFDGLVKKNLYFYTFQKTAHPHLPHPWKTLLIISIIYGLIGIFSLPTLPLGACHHAADFYQTVFHSTIYPSF